MNRFESFPAEMLEHLKLSLRPFNPVITAVLPDQRAWFSYFGTDRRPVSMGTIKAAGFDIAVYYTAPENPVSTVLIIPGFLDHSQIHGRLINTLLDRGCAVLMYDLPGHGFSSGDRGTISDFRLYGTAAKAAAELHRRYSLPGKLHLMGHSTGGASILELFRTDGKIWDGETILIAPLIRSPLWRLSTAGTVLADRSKIKTTPRVFQKTSHDPEFLKLLRREPHRIDTFVVEWSISLAAWVPLIESMEPSNLPVTVIQGTDDFTVGWRTNLKTLNRLFPQMDLTVVPAGRHHLLNESEQYREPVYAKIFEKICSRPHV